MTSSSTTALSSAPVQFIVKVIAPPSCTILPEAILVGQSCTTVKSMKHFHHITWNKLLWCKC